MPVKKNQHSNPSSDILRLFCLLLFGGEEYSLTRLSEIFNCGKQKIIRMIRVIEAMNPDEAESPLMIVKRGKENVYRLRKPDNRNPKVTLSASELEYLVCCRELVQGLMPPQSLRDAESGLTKAATLLENYEERTAALNPPVQVLAKAQVVYDDSSPVFGLLLDCIKNRRVCVIDYLAARNAASREHLVIPVCLVSYGECLYLRGWMLYKAVENDIESKREGLLALHRMKSVKPMGRPLTAKKWSGLPPLSQPEVFGLADEVDPFKARIRFCGPAARYVRERIYSRDQTLVDEDDGAVVWAGTARSETEIIRWVLSCGEEAELLAPAYLRRRLAGALKAVKQKYRKIP